MSDIPHMAAISQKPVVFRELRHSTASRNQTHRNHAQSNRACHTYPTPRNIWRHIPELVWQLLSLLPRSCSRYGNGIPLSHHCRRIPQHRVVRKTIARLCTPVRSAQNEKHSCGWFHKSHQTIRNIRLDVMKSTNSTRYISAKRSDKGSAIYFFLTKSISYPKVFFKASRSVSVSTTGFASEPS